MSTPSDPQPPREPGAPTREPGAPSTQEIPVVQPAAAPVGATRLPPHPGATIPAPVAMDEPVPTGPVDFVPGLPGAPPVPPPATSMLAPTAAPTAPEAAPDAAPSGKRHRVRMPADRSVVVGAALAVLAVVLLELGLSLDFGTDSYWSAVPLWSAFATLCAVLGLLAFAAASSSGGRARAGALWRTAAGGLVGLAVFWLLVVLPVVASDRGFLLTAALGALGAALWVGPGRKA